MLPGYDTIAEEAAKLAEVLPSSVLASLADAIAACDPADWQSARTAVLSTIPHARYRSVAGCYLDCWHTRAAEVPPAVAAMAVLAAAAVVHERRATQSIELVWTGPDAGIIPVRRTEQALLQVIESATERLTIVSYAVYRIPHVRDALAEAVSRGCQVRAILEGQDHAESEIARRSLAALGAKVADRVGIFVWPAGQRLTDGNGKPGVMHVKAAVADGHLLFLSSANLTEHAFTVNMELGVLVRSGDLPGQVESQIDRLIENGVLVPV
jgi:phosphatidylserine/phosphatidylglycerophosphate/cardiolipin synthase-like enzyme